MIILHSIFKSELQKFQCYTYQTKTNIIQIFQISINRSIYYIYIKLYTILANLEKFSIITGESYKKIPKIVV